MLSLFFSFSWSAESTVIDTLFELQIIQCLGLVVVVCNESLFDLLYCEELLKVVKHFLSQLLVRCVL